MPLARYDLHLHTEVSPDCDTAISAIEAHCLALGLTGIAVTDHDSLEGALRLRDRAKKLHIIIAEEISTRDGDVIGLFLKERIPPKLSALDTMQAIHAQGGLVYLPHPFDKPRARRNGGASLHVLAPQIDIVETFNGKIGRGHYNTLAADFAARHGKIAAGGSDAHTLGAIGTVVNEFEGLTETDSPAAFLEGLRKAHIVGKRRSPMSGWIARGRRPLTLALRRLREKKVNNSLPYNFLRLFVSRNTEFAPLPDGSLIRAGMPDILSGKMPMTAVSVQNTLVSKPRPRRCLILANPEAGGLRPRSPLTRLGLRLTEALGGPATDGFAHETPMPLIELTETAAEVGLAADVEPIPPKDQVAALVREAEREGYDTVVVAGGDGTIHNVAQALIGSSLRLGILPVGSANNIARALRLPFRVAEALQVIKEGIEHRIDVGRINDEYFIEGAGVGLFADALSAYGTEEPRRNQVMKALRNVGPLFWNPPVRQLRLTLDGVTQNEAANMVTVANAAYLGENFPVAPDAHMEDGLFDVIVVGAMTRGEMARFARTLMRGEHLRLPHVHRYQARTVEIARVVSSLAPIPVHADDHIVTTTPVRMEVVPGALRVLTLSPAVKPPETSD